MVPNWIADFKECGREICLTLSYILVVQTVFIILICNNQLLDWIENEFIWIVSHIPGLGSMLPRVIANLKAVREKYMKAPHPHQVSPLKTQVPTFFYVQLSSMFVLSTYTCLWAMLGQSPISF